MNIRRVIMDVYYMVEADYNVSGVLQERASNQRRKMSTGFQLHRMGYRPDPKLSFESLTPEGKQIYRCLERRYGFVSVRDVHTVGDIQKWYPDAEFKAHPKQGYSEFVLPNGWRWRMGGTTPYLHLPVIPCYILIAST